MYLNFKIIRSPIGFSIDKTDHTMELVHEWFPIEKFIKVDTPFLKDSKYENELMAAVTLTLNALFKVEIKYYGKFGHDVGQIQHIDIMRRTEIHYRAFCLGKQTVTTTIPGFQCLKRRIQYMASHTHKPIFHTSNSYDESNFIRLT